MWMESPGDLLGSSWCPEGSGIPKSVGVVPGKLRISGQSATNPGRDDSGVRARPKRQGNSVR